MTMTDPVPCNVLKHGRCAFVYLLAAALLFPLHSNADSNLALAKSAVPTSLAPVTVPGRGNVDDARGYLPAHHPLRTTGGLVVSQSRPASVVGVEILRKGGNAVDAAIAVGLAEAVTLPRAGNWVAAAPW